MKKVIYLLFISLVFIPVLVCASTFNNAENLTKRYIKNFLYPERYIKIDSGDFISREEVEKTMVRKDSDNRLLTVSSYMYEGTKFWAKNKYVISEKIEQRPQDENHKTKVTEIVLHNTKVKGTGKFNDPWIFVDTYEVTIKSNGNGTVDNEQTVTKSVNSNGTVSFTIAPNSGYKYLNNDCGGNSEVAGNILTIRNIEKDIVCSVTFEASMYSNTLPVPYKVVHINLTNSDVTYRFDNDPKGPEPNAFNARYGIGYYTDDTLKTRIGKLTTLPSRKGWTFKGYYVGDTQNASTQIVNEKGFFEQTYQLLKDNETQEKITFDVVPNRYKITFHKENGTGGTPEVENWPYEHDMPVIVIPGRAGYTFDGYYTLPNGGGDKYYNTDGKASRIFNPNTPGNLALFAKWKECPVGYYCPGDNVAYKCPNGYSTAGTKSEKCTQCRYWDSCHTGHNTCSYGCSTCSYSYECNCSRRCYRSPGGFQHGHTDCITSCSTCSYSEPCGCSSCYYGENTCRGAWVYLTNENSCVVSSTEYIVNLDKDGGSGGLDSYKLTYYGTKPVAIINGNKDEIYIDIPTRLGYTFGGYYTAKNGGGTKIIDVNNIYAVGYDPDKKDYTNTEINNLIAKVNGTIKILDLKKETSPSENTFTLYAYWIKCPRGSKCPGDNKNWLCEPGKYQDETGQTTCKTCVKESMQGEYGKDNCVACSDGSTNNLNGSISCMDECSNNMSVAEWQPATWNTNNTVTNNCKIKSCKTGYRLENNTCVLNNVDVVILAYPGGTVQVDGGTSYNIGSNAKSGTVSLSIGSHTFKDSHTGVTKTITVSADTTQVVVGYYIGNVFGDLQLGTLRNNGERYDEPKTSSEYTIPSGNYTKMQIYAKAYILQYLYGTRTSGYDVYAPNASASFAITSTLTTGNLTTCSTSLGWGNAKLGPSNTNLNRVSSDCSLNKTINFDSTGGKIKFTFKSYNLAQSAQTAYGNDLARRFKILAKSRNLSVVYIY